MDDGLLPQQGFLDRETLTFRNILWWNFWWAKVQMKVEMVRMLYPCRRERRAASARYCIMSLKVVLSLPDAQVSDHKMIATSSCFISASPCQAQHKGVRQALHWTSALLAKQAESQYLKLSCEMQTRPRHLRQFDTFVCHSLDGLSHLLSLLKRHI